MLTSYSRVTVVSGTRRVDLALPSALPMADVVPQVLRFCAPADSGEDPGELTLGRVGGQSLGLSQSLAEAGVRDGDVIELRSYSDHDRAAFVEDVRDSVEDSVDGAGGIWTSRSTVTFVLVVTAAVLAGYLAVTLFSLWSAAMSGRTLDAMSDAEVLSGVLCVAALAAMTAAGATWGAPWTPYVTSTVAALWAFVVGIETTAGATDGTALPLACGALAAVAVAGLMRLVTPRAITLLAATVVLFAAAAVLTVAEESDTEPGIVVRVVALLAVLSIGVMPRLSIAVGGISSADYRVRNAGRMSDAQLNARFRESSGLLLGCVIGVSVLVALIGYWLGLRDQDWSQDVWDRILSLSLALALALRSRVFSRLQYMVPLRVAAVFILLASVRQLASESADLSPWIPSLVSLAGLACLGIGALVLSEITRARIKRLLNLVEFVVVVDLVVVTMGAVALYDYIGDR